jgi:multiple sugar transport system substrate-binding protein
MKGKVPLKIIVLAVLFAFVFMYGFARSRTEDVEEGVSEPAVEEKEEMAAEEAEPVELIVWWWGDQENPGSKDWMLESIEKYKTVKPNVTIKETLQSTDTIIPVWRSAVEARDVPDIQYFWGGIWTLEDVWLGNIEPLSNHWSRAELDHVVSPVDFDGKIWAAPWYTNLMTFVYNKKVLKAAGVDPDIHAISWDEFMDICQKVKDAGYIPYSMGIKDNLWGNWLFAHFAKQNLSSMKEVLAPIIGKASYSDPKYSEWLYRFKEMIDKGYINDDATSVELYASMDNFIQGKAAFTLAVSGTILSWREKMGEENIGIMLPPAFGTGAYAKSICTGTHGLGIPALAKQKEEAAEFLKFLHTTERLNAYYEKTGALVADDRLDLNLITSPLTKSMLEMLQKYPDVHYGNIAPQQLDFEGVEPVLQLLLSGDTTVEEAAKQMDNTIEKWRALNPDMLEKYIEWYEGY